VTWWLEVLPVLVALPILAFTARRFPLTPLVYTLIANPLPDPDPGRSLHVCACAARVLDAGLVRFLHATITIESGISCRVSDRR
jgi:hypothetical protein